VRAEATLRDFLLQGTASQVDIAVRGKYGRHGVAVYEREVEEGMKMAPVVVGLESRERYDRGRKDGAGRALRRCKRRNNKKPDNLIGIQHYRRLRDGNKCTEMGYEEGQQPHVLRHRGKRRHGKNGTAPGAARYGL
jgi:hypothetical protein